MTHIKSLFILLAFSLVLLIFHYIGIQYFYYWSISWYDTVAHLLGGVILGLSITIFSKAKNLSEKSLIIYGAGFALLVAILWEIFEYRAGITSASSKYALDTTLDILLGLIGALIAIKVGSRRV